MKFFDWLKVFGTAVLIEILLVALSIAEVFVWSSMQNPSPGMNACSAHANQIGPPLSAIFGALFMYLFTARYVKRNTQNQLYYAIALPTAYLVVDLAILVFYPINWLEHLPVLVAASAPKYGGALIAYYRLRNKGTLKQQAAERNRSEEAKVESKV
ncbi:MAG: hypothetical protein K2X77_17050 [Candidatus Obscuribacterales bacterium]|jgi:hypothetical protein|nr:hypothetical protein [Candidatus Obscuribacterales bacterium]